MIAISHVFAERTQILEQRQGLDADVVPLGGIEWRLGEVDHGFNYATNFFSFACVARRASRRQ